MKTRHKVLIAIILAVLASWLIQTARPQESLFLALEKDLNQRYQEYNQVYFQNKLPKNVLIDFSETDNTYLATTVRMSNGRFHIAFNRRTVRTPLTGRLFLLHEMCHIPTYDYGNDDIGFHGKEWRACMMQLDMQGAFRTELIYSYEVPK